MAAERVPPGGNLGAGLQSPPASCVGITPPPDTHTSPQPVYEAQAHSKRGLRGSSHHHHQHFGFPRIFSAPPIWGGGGVRRVLTEQRQVLAGWTACWGTGEGWAGWTGEQDIGAGRAALGPRPPPISFPAPAPALPRTCAGLSPSPEGSRRALLGDQRTRRSRAQGEGAGNFPPRLPGPAPLPPPPPGGGAPLGEFHRSARAPASLGWGS